MKKVFKYDLSLIIPVYNCGNFLRKTLKKIEKISNAKLQLIMINDGSTDDTSQICGEFAKRHDNVLFIDRQENKGVSFTRNQGLDLAKDAKYVGFLDADDDFNEDIYSILLKNAFKSDADVSICNYYEVDDGIKLRSKYEYKDGIVSRDDMVRAFFLDRIGPTVWDAIFSSSIVNSVRFDEKLKVAEDNVFVLRLLIRSKRNFVTNRRLYYYVQNSASAMHSLSSDMMIVGIEKYLMPEERKEMQEEFPEEYAFWSLQLAVHSIHAIANASNRKNFREAEKLIRKINKKTLREIINNRLFPASVRIEIGFLAFFGGNIYIRIFPVLKILKRFLRR